MKYLDKSFIISGLVVVVIVAVVCKFACKTYVYSVDDKGNPTGKPTAQLKKSFFGFFAGGDLTPAA